MDETQGKAESGKVQCYLFCEACPDTNCPFYDDGGDKNGTSRAQ
jgi:hypothetical protein